ncbi:hypothetical protein ACHAXN_003567 [Cyclotella atomus]
MFYALVWNLSTRAGSALVFLQVASDLYLSNTPAALRYANFCIIMLFFTGKMHPAEAIMGLPEEGSVLKYDLSAESESGVVPMSDDKQTLMDTNITQADGMTVMTFAKVLDEDQYPLVAGDNTCIYAESTSNAFGFHNNHPHYFVLKLADSSGSDATMKRGFMAIAFGAMAVWFGL